MWVICTASRMNSADAAFFDWPLWVRMISALVRVVERVWEHVGVGVRVGVGVTVGESGSGSEGGCGSRGGSALVNEGGEWERQWLREWEWV